MKKIIFISKRRCDIIIFDVIGVAFIHRCIPDNAKLVFLDFRKTFPLGISGRFMKGVFLALCSKPLFAKKSIHYLLLSGLIRHLSPKLLLSFADNNQVLAQYAERNPKFPVVLVQNAVRDSVGSISNRYNLPTYLSFGEVERFIFKDLQITSRRYLPIGSIKLGLALEKAENQKVDPEIVAFISHFRAGLAAQNASIIEKMINKNQQLLFKLTGDFVRSKSLRLRIISKVRIPEEQHLEREYFESLIPDMSLEFITAYQGPRELDAYVAGLTSQLIVHPGSTLGFELLGAGKKVLCGATINKDLVQTWGAAPYTDVLPNCCKLAPDIDWSDFYEHANRLWEMNDEEYSEKIKQARHSLMNMPNAIHAHEKLKNIIGSLI
jgi:surface carbohydrate biosynthesis protein